MKKYLWVILAAAFVFTGCMPKEETQLVADPELEATGKPEIDFVLLHNDTLDALASVHEGEPYSFISAIDISGDDSSKTVTVTATAVDEATAEDAEAFAQAILCFMNDSAVMQYPGFTVSSPEDFGSFYDTYSVSLTVSMPDGSELYTLSAAAGEEIPLSPDYEKYVDDWERDYNIVMENVIYDADGNIVSYG